MDPSFFTPWQKRMLANAATALAVCFFVLLIGGGIWAVGLLMRKLQWILIPVVIGAVIAYVQLPVVDWVHEKWRWSRSVSVVVVFGVGIVAVLGIVAMLLPAVIQELTDFARKTPAYFEKAVKAVGEFMERARSAEAPVAWQHFMNRLTASVTASLPDLAKGLTDKLPALLSNAFSLLGAVVGFLIIPVYVYYFLKDPDAFTSGWKLYVPVSNEPVRRDIIKLVHEINESVKAFFRGQCIVASCVGALAAVGFYLIGVDFALLLGIWVGIFDLVPFFGIVAGAIPAMLIGFAQHGNWHVPVLAAGVCLGVHLIENWILAPKIVGNKTGLHPVAIVLSILIWGKLLGFIGVLLAVPLTSTLKVLFNHYLWQRLPAKS
ncbi:MAG: AI-2E family transporter [Verrucomicrobia bacterium]|nr:AI-2E family transporter [Verrucomicrobiota bacterium]